MTWRNIDEHYEISNEGKVRNIQTGKLLKPSLVWGYEKLRLAKSKKTIYVHRCVAQLFVPNPRNLNTIDHIDRNKTNNLHTNLRWVTPKENAANCIQWIRPERPEKIRKLFTVKTIFKLLNEGKTEQEVFDLLK